MHHIHKCQDMARNDGLRIRSFGLPSTTSPPPLASIVNFLSNSLREILTGHNIITKHILWIRGIRTQSPCLTWMRPSQAESLMHI